MFNDQLNTCNTLIRGYFCIDDTHNIPLNRRYYCINLIVFSRYDNGNFDESGINFLQQFLHKLT